MRRYQLMFEAWDISYVIVAYCIDILIQFLHFRDKSFSISIAAVNFFCALNDHESEKFRRCSLSVARASCLEISYFLPLLSVSLCRKMNFARPHWLQTAFKSKIDELSDNLQKYYFCDLICLSINKDRFEVWKGDYIFSFF